MFLILESSSLVVVLVHSFCFKLPSHHSIEIYSHRIDKVRNIHSHSLPPIESIMDIYSNRPVLFVCLFVTGLGRLIDFYFSFQIPCIICNDYIDRDILDGHKICRLCRAAIDSSFNTSQSSSSYWSFSFSFPIRPDSCLDPLTHDQRMMMVTMEKENTSRKEIANQINCSLNTVGQWIRRWNISSTFNWR